MCWSSEAAKDMSGVFFTGTSSGIVAVWKVQNTKVKDEWITVTYVSEIDTGMSRLLALHWHFTTHQSGSIMLVTFSSMSINKLVN